MIQGYRDKSTQRFAAGEHIKAFSGFEKAADKALAKLDGATSLADLGALRGNHLEALKGGREGQFSIRINDQWRVCFKWSDGEPGPSEVEIVDYH